MKQTIQILFDRLAISASLLCAIHCMLLPVLLAVFPTLVALPVGEETFHQLMLWFVVPSSVLAVTLGCIRHKDNLVLFGSVVGLVIIALAAFVGHDLLGETGEKIATLTGAAILAFSHWRNYSLCRHDDCDHDHHH